MRAERLLSCEEEVEKLILNCDLTVPSELRSVFFYESYFVSDRERTHATEPAEVRGQFQRSVLCFFLRVRILAPAPELCVPGLRASCRLSCLHLPSFHRSAGVADACCCMPRFTGVSGIKLSSGLHSGACTYRATPCLHSPTVKSTHLLTCCSLSS